MTKKPSLAIIFSSFTAISLVGCIPPGYVLAPAPSPSPGMSLPVGTNVVINILYPGSVVNQPMPGYQQYPIPGTTTPPTGVVPLTISRQGTSLVASYAVDPVAGYTKWQPGQPISSAPNAQYSWRGGLWFEPSVSGFTPVYGSVSPGTNNVVFPNVPIGFKGNFKVSGKDTIGMILEVFAALDPKNAVALPPGVVIEADNSGQPSTPPGALRVAVYQ